MSRFWIGLQHFAGEADPVPDLTGRFKPAENEEDYETVVLPPGEKPPEEKTGEPQKITLSLAEYETLKKNADSNSALNASVGKLAEAVNQPQVARVAQANEITPQRKTETDEEFATRVEASLWEKGKTLGTLREVVAQTVLPVAQQQFEIMAKDHRRALRNDVDDGAFFRKYEKEIDAVHASLPQNERLMPSAWDKALEEVRRAHQGDIVSEKVADEVTKRLQELGIEIKDGKAVLKASGEETPTAPAPGAPKRVILEGSSAPGAAGRKVRYITAEEAKKQADLKRRAEEAGVDVEAFRQTRGA